MVAKAPDNHEPSSKASSNFIAWDDPSLLSSTPSEQEERTIQAVSDQFNRFQKLNFDEHQHCFRGTHLKTLGCVVGKLKIKEGLPEHLAQGMFKDPREHDIIFRYSSLTPKILPDNVPAPRGCAFKIFDVKVDKLITEDHNTQDWTFNNYPILELRTARDTNEIADALERNWSDGAAFGRELGERKDAEVATRAAGIPNQHMVAMTQWSQSAYRYGDYVAKLALFPVTQPQLDLRSWVVPSDSPSSILSTSLREHHLAHPVAYSLRVQLLQNLEEQPVEDIGFEWNEGKYPFEEVAVLEFEKQDAGVQAFRVWWDDRITCNSWHGLVEHTPLGSTNRTRRVVYAESRKLRMRINGVDKCIEPESLAEVPFQPGVA